MTATFTMNGQLTKQLMAVGVIPSGNILSMAQPAKAIALDVGAGCTDESQLNLTRPDACIAYAVSNPKVAVVRDGKVFPVVPVLQRSPCRSPIKTGPVWHPSLSVSDR